MSGHTPGPWRAVETEQPVPYYNGLVALTAQSPYIAIVTDGRVCDSMEWPANARLMAAAPELLMRCIARVERCLCAMPRPTHYGDLYGLPGLCNECNADLAAIAKAAGK